MKNVTFRARSLVLALPGAGVIGGAAVEAFHTHSPCLGGRWDREGVSCA